MCFLTKGSKLRIATKDIECYKCIQKYKDYCKSLHYEFKYEYNKVYSGKSKLALFLSWLFNDDVTHEAYHSFTPNRYFGNVKCIIPKGSLYLIDKYNEYYCSTSIIIKKSIC